MNLSIGYLYGDLMNIYGDTGNIVTLRKRAEWREIDVNVKQVSLENNLKSGQFDIFFFGGGQDQAQELVSKDLESSKGEIIKKEVLRGVPLLSICGGYQLLGEYYLPHQGPKLKGVGIFPAHTEASKDRMIGNIVVDCEWLMGNGKDKKTIHHNPSTINYLVGFENHSGKTYLKKGGTPLGRVLKGFGNNGADKTEGCIYKNAIGCYMHGSLLPKNPKLADWFLEKALEVKYGEKIKLKELDDSFEQKAHGFAVSKFG